MPRVTRPKKLYDGWQADLVEVETLIKMGKSVRQAALACGVSETNYWKMRGMTQVHKPRAASNAIWAMTRERKHNAK